MARRFIIDGVRYTVGPNNLRPWRAGEPRPVKGNAGAMFHIEPLDGGPVMKVDDLWTGDKTFERDTARFTADSPNKFYRGIDSSAAR